MHFWIPDSRIIILINATYFIICSKQVPNLQEYKEVQCYTVTINKILKIFQILGLFLEDLGVPLSALCMPSITLTGRNTKVVFNKHEFNYQLENRDFQIIAWLEIEDPLICFSADQHKFAFILLLGLGLKCLKFALVSLSINMTILVYIKGQRVNAARYLYVQKV